MNFSNFCLHDSYRQFTQCGKLPKNQPWGDTARWVKTGAKFATFPTKNHGQRSNIFVFLDVSGHSEDFNFWPPPLPFTPTPAPKIIWAERAHQGEHFWKQNLHLNPAKCWPKWLPKVQKGPFRSFWPTLRPCGFFNKIRALFTQNTTFTVVWAINWLRS